MNGIANGWVMLIFFLISGLYFLVSSYKKSLNKYSPIVGVIFFMILYLVVR